MVGSTIVVVQLDAHRAQPDIQFVFLVGPDFDAFGAFARFRLAFNEVFDLIDRPFLIARFFLSFGIDDIEEVHIEFAVAAQDIQFFNQNHVGVRVGLLRADGCR